jgi:uncharacterized protein YaiI (UPF0178 family)
VRIWIDADAVPGPIRDIVLRSAQRLAIETIFVANKFLSLPQSPHIQFIKVSHGPDIVDAYILAEAVAGDLAITQDIPLAANLVSKGVTVISPRGDLFNEDNINEILASRNLMQELREGGVVTGGPAPFSDKAKRIFAGRFDSSLQKLMHKRKK